MNEQIHLGEKSQHTYTPTYNYGAHRELLGYRLPFILRDAATTHHASLCTRGTRQTVAVFPLEMASEMGILLWEDDCGVLSGSTPLESERSRARQREELN